MKQLVAIAALMIAAGCGKPAEPPQAPLTVRTSFYPLTYFAEAIGGEDVTVSSPIPPDADPAHWVPDAAAIRQFQEADLVLLNGANFEKWTSSISLPVSRVVMTAEPFKDSWLSFQEAVAHRHGGSGAHTHAGVNGHTWMDPVQARMQAMAVFEALARLRFEETGRYREGYTKLAGELDRLDLRFRKVTELLGNRTIAANHPAYDYIARRYGWKLRMIDIDPDTVSSAKAVAAVRSVRPAVMLWESAPGVGIAGVSSVVFSPCETRPEKSDYIAVMNENLDRLIEAL